MDRMQNEQTMTDGIGSEQNRRVPATARGRDLQARVDGGNVNGERRSMAPRKRKPKHRRHREPMPQPPKPMWPLVVGTILILLYIISPIDIIPDMPVVGIWDDIALAVFGIRKWEQRRKDDRGGRREFDRPMHDDAARYDDWRDAPGRLPPPLRAPSLPPECESPGFFTRLFKAITYLFTGGGAL